MAGRLMGPLVSFLLAMAFGAALILLSGRNVISAFTALYEGAFVGRTNLELTVLNAIPLVFTGLSVALGFRAGLFNIGAEGQVMLGGIVATWLGTSLRLGPVWTPAVALLGGALAGIVWAFPAAWLKVRKGIHEVITTLMLSYIALYLMTYARRYTLFDPASTTQSSVTVPPGARLLSLSEVAPFLHLGYTRLHVGLFIALVVAAAGWWLLYRTVWGYEIRAVGANPVASGANGIAVGRTIILALSLGGFIAGLGGAVQLLGLYYRISTDSFIGLGFSGFFVALLGRNDPLGVLPAAVLFGALRAGGLGMQLNADVPINITQALEGAIILFLAAPALAETLFRIRRREAA